METQDSGPFEGELARVLLLAYAAGNQVVGDWLLRDPDPVVPNVEVVIVRANGRTDGPISHERTTYTPEGTASFKDRLQTFVLTRFSKGDDIEGTWRVRFARLNLPDWDVQISLDPDEEINRGKTGISSVDS